MDPSPSVLVFCMAAYELTVASRARVCYSARLGHKLMESLKGLSRVGLTCDFISVCYMPTVFSGQT